MASILYVYGREHVQKDIHIYQCNSGFVEWRSQLHWDRWGSWLLEGNCVGKVKIK